MADERMGCHLDISLGRSLRWIKRPLEVPPRTKEAGKDFVLMKETDSFGFEVFLDAFSQRRECPWRVRNVVAIVVVWQVSFLHKLHSLGHIFDLPSKIRHRFR